MHPEHLEAAHQVCAWLTVERFLIEARIHQAALLRSGVFKKLPYLDALLQLQTIIAYGICTKMGVLSEDEIPPTLDLLARLPAHMQMQLEQAIEAERRGEANHHAVHVECCGGTLGIGEVVEAAIRRYVGGTRQRPQSGHQPA